MPLRFVVPGQGTPPGAGPFPALLAEAAGRVGGVYEAEAEHGFFGRFRGADGRVRPILGKALGLNSDAAAALAADKHYTARVLRAEGLPAPDGVLAFSPDWQARMRRTNRAVADRVAAAEFPSAFAARVGFPVIVKPNTAYGGRGVRLSPDPAALASDLDEGFEEDDILRIEPVLPGRDYRVLLLDGDVVLAYERRPPAVTGDGCSTVATLIESAPAQGRTMRRDDPRVLRSLAAQGLMLGAVPAPGMEVRLLANANLSTGGRMVDLTGQLPEAALRLAARAAATVGLRFAGVDILAPDLSQGIAGAVVLEVNSAPGLDIYATLGPSHRERAVAVLAQALGALF